MVSGEVVLIVRVEGRGIQGSRGLWSLGFKLALGREMGNWSHMYLDHPLVLLLPHLIQHCKSLVVLLLSLKCV